MPLFQDLDKNFFFPYNLTLNKTLKLPLVGRSAHCLVSKMDRDVKNLVSFLSLFIKNENGLGVLLADIEKLDQGQVLLLLSSIGERVYSIDKAEN